MTVNELIAQLQSLPDDQRNMEIRVWLPGSQITIDGSAFKLLPTPLNPSPVILVEGNVVAGSALDEIALSR